MTTSNRQIKTGFAPQQQMITIEAMQDTKHDGKAITAGQTFEVSKSEAKRLLAVGAKVFRIKMD